MKELTAEFETKTRTGAIVLVSELNKAGIGAVACDKTVYINLHSRPELYKLLMAFLSATRKRAA